jgi:hypothetical protein
VNSRAEPNEIAPRVVAGKVRLDGSLLEGSLEPLSWNVIRLAK